MKQAMALVLIPLILSGCSPKEDVDIKELSSAIIPYEPMSENFMDAVEYPEESRDIFQKHAEIHMQARREFLSDNLSRDFSPEELHKLNKIFNSELVIRVQRILVSDECLIGSIELSKPELTKLEQNHHQAPKVTRDVRIKKEN